MKCDHGILSPVTANSLPWEMGLFSLKIKRRGKKEKRRGKEGRKRKKKKKEEKERERGCD
jgi:hypothetical protein